MLGWHEFNMLVDGLDPWGAVATHYKSVQKRVNEAHERKIGKPSANASSFWAMLDGLKK